MPPKENDHGIRDGDRSSRGSNTALAEREPLTLADVRNISRPDATANDTVNNAFGTPEFVGIEPDAGDIGTATGDKKGTGKGDGRGDQTPEEAAAQKEADKVANEQNVDVQVTTVDGRLTYTFYTRVDGERRDLLTTDNPNYREEIEQYQQETVQRLEEQYRINISQDGETFPYGARRAGARTPTMSELTALEEGLRYSVPSNLTRSGDPLPVVYSNEVNNEGAVAYFSTRNGDPMIVFQPNNGERSVDAQVETVTHEFAHHGDWEARENIDTGGILGQIRQLPEALLNNALGYTRAEDGSWLIRSKDGATYKWEDVDGRGDSDEHRWYRMNREGEYMDENGKVVERDEAQTFTREEMRERAAVRPPTDYFPNPEEVWAEVQTYYRAGEERRAELFEMSPQLYRVAKQFDQQEINTFYPPREDGSPSYIRLPSGEVVPNTPANAGEVLAWEAGVITDIAHGGKEGGGLKDNPKWQRLIEKAHSHEIGNRIAHVF